MKYIFLLLLAFLTFSPAQADAVWFSSSWNYKVKVEVNPNKVGTTTAVTSMPVYNDCGGFPTTFWTNASSTGADIRVVESDDTTETAFELVSFSTTSKTCELHFMADSLGTTSTSTFYIYYGNATATAYAVTDTYGRNNVWGGYALVAHGNESSGTRTNSTGGTNLSQNGTVNSGTGKVGTNGINSPGGTTNYLSGADGSTYDILGNISTTFWLNVTTAPTSGQLKALMTKDSAGASQRSYAFDYYNNGGTKQIRAFITKDGAAINATEVSLNKDLSTATWAKVDIIGTVANPNATKFTFYVNGVSQGNGTVTYSNGTSSAIYNSTTAYNLGRYVYASAPIIDGVFDEVRLSSTTKSSSYLWTEYNNQSSTSTFFYIGAEEAYSAGTSTVASTTGSIIWFE